MATNHIFLMDAIRTYKEEFCINSSIKISLKSCIMLKPPNQTVLNLRKPYWMNPAGLNEDVVRVCFRSLSLQDQGSEEDVGEVLLLNVFVFSSPTVWIRGFWATEGKINTVQTSPGTQAIPGGILGMRLQRSGLPHPESCVRAPCAVYEFIKKQTRVKLKKKKKKDPILLKPPMRLCFYCCEIR